jgi:hypothetical protein
MSVKDYIEHIAPTPDSLKDVTAEAKRKGLNKLSTCQIDAEIAVVSACLNEPVRSEFPRSSRSTGTVPGDPHKGVDSLLHPQRPEESITALDHGDQCGKPGLRLGDMRTTICLDYDMNQTRSGVATLALWPGIFTPS